MAAAACWAQAPPKSKPKRHPPEITVTLYREAKAALAGVPAPLEPIDLMTIAEAESIRHPKQARIDLAQAFRDAVALSAPQDDSDADDAQSKWYAAIKRGVELEVTVRLTKGPAADFTVAHALVRQADVPRAQLYTELIGSAGSQAMEKAGRGFPAEQGLLARTFGGIGYTPKTFKRNHLPSATPGYSVLELAQECYQADGSFPFLGVLIALNTYQTPGVDQRPLVLLAYTRAAQVTTPRLLNSATSALMKGHQLYPDLDPQMETAAAGMLAHVQAALPTSGDWTGELEAAGNRLLALIAQVDESRAEELRAQYADFALTPKQLFGSPRPLRSFTARRRQANVDPATALASAENMPTISGQEKEAKFRQLVNLANMLARQNPKPAAGAAAQALDLMNSARLSANMRRVALLALRTKKYLHDPINAENLIRKCLDAAEKKAIAAQQAFDNAGPAQQRSLAQDFEGNGAPEVDLWAYAAQIDLNLAMARAQQTSADYFKPLFLERVAVGQEMLHPWWQ